jgi:hypothetical protein
MTTPVASLAVKGLSPSRVVFDALGRRLQRSHLLLLHRLRIAWAVQKVREAPWAGSGVRMRLGLGVGRRRQRLRRHAKHHRDNLHADTGFTVGHGC